MNGRLDKVAMTNKLMQLKRELHSNVKSEKRESMNVMEQMNILIEYSTFWMNIGNDQ